MTTSVSPFGGARWLATVGCASALWFAPALGLAQDAQPDKPEPAAPVAATTPPAAPAAIKRVPVLILPTVSVQDKVTSIVPERIDDTARKRIVSDSARMTLLPSFGEIRKQLAGQGQASAAVYKAEQLYAQGIGLLTAGENQAALQKFQQAVVLMETNILDVQNYAVLKDAILNLSLASFLTGYDLDARKRMKEFAYLDQGATLNPEKFPKDLVAVYTKEVKKVKKVGPGKLEITSSVPNAQIFVDGVSKGTAPATLTDVGAGYHNIVVRGPNNETWHEKFRVRGKGKLQKIEAKPVARATAGAVATSTQDNLPDYYKDLLVKLKTGTFSAVEIEPYLSELAKQAGAEYVGWTLVFKKGSEYVAAPFLYSKDTNEVVQLEQTAFNFELSNVAIGVGAMTQRFDSAIAALPTDKKLVAVTLLEPPKPVAPPTEIVRKDPEQQGAVAAGPVGPTPVTPLPPEPAAGGTSTWTYVALGAAGVAVVGLIAGGVYALSSDGDGGDGFRAEVSW